MIIYLMQVPNIFLNVLQGRIFTGTAIGLLIGGGAYASTVDEATFWYWH